MAKEIKHTFFFQHPRGIVWDYLTKAELLSHWLMENDIQPVVGHKFQFRAKPAPEIDFDGISYCEVLKVVPLTHLSYSWNCNPIQDGYKINTVVIWELMPKENGTELRLRQTGFKENEYNGFYMAMNNGWSKRAEVLLQILNSNGNDATKF